MQSKAERAVRAKIAKAFITGYCYRHRDQMPTKEEIEQHVADEMTRAKVFGISQEFEEEIWALVYDEALTGASGDDKKRLENLCNEWSIPAGGLACREKVKVIYLLATNSESRNTKRSTLDKVL
jgi:hypothetical protein